MWLVGVGMGFALPQPGVYPGDLHAFGAHGAPPNPALGEPRSRLGGLFAPFLPVECDGPSKTPGPPPSTWNGAGMGQPGSKLSPSWDLGRSCLSSEGAGPPPFEPGVESAFDILGYVANLRIDPDEQVVRGTMTITAIRRTDVPSGDFLFHYEGGAPSLVTLNGEAVDATYEDGVWHVPAETLAAEVAITWSRTGNSDGLGIQFDDGITWSVDEPDGARNWMPVYDEPWDKATWTWEIEAPAGLTVAANGELISVSAGEPEDDGRAWDTWKWVFDQPIATYLVALHIADFSVYDLSEDIPVTVWSTQSGTAVADTFGATPDILAFFADRYGPYPWTRYGIVTVPFGGAMEHTTVTSFGEGYTGLDADLVNSHEIAHHWFGDDVTLADWRDIWLNEGFASYSEALWYESLYGQEGLTEYLDWQRSVYYLLQAQEGEFPLYDPDSLFGGTVYDKGSWVVHMLRGMLGDEVFFYALQEYLSEYAYSNASTAEFEESVEQSTGVELSWFFDGYVYGTGEPTLQFAYRSTTDGVIVVIESDTAMPLPIPLRIVGADQDLDTRVTLTSGTACALLLPGFEVEDVLLDPDLWVLTDDRLELSTAAVDACETALADADTPDDTAEIDRPGAYLGAPDCACGGGDPAAALWLGGVAVFGARRRRPEGFGR